MQEFENGIAARKHFRVLDKKLDELREEFRKDPRNQLLSDYELNQGAKGVELEDEEERLLYKELRNYVVRDGKLGSRWENYLASQKTANKALHLTDDEQEGDGLDAIPGMEADPVYDENGAINDGGYQGVDEHYADGLDGPADDMDRPSGMKSFPSSITISPNSSRS
jgi:hypothetical protein